MRTYLVVDDDKLLEELVEVGFVIYGRLFTLWCSCLVTCLRTSMHFGPTSWKLVNPPLLLYQGHVEFKVVFFEMGVEGHSWGIEWKLVVYIQDWRFSMQCLWVKICLRCEHTGRLTYTPCRPSCCHTSQRNNGCLQQTSFWVPADRDCWPWDLLSRQW